MIVWSGLGFLVGVFVFGAALLCNLSFDALWGEGYYSSHEWTVGMAMFIAAAISWMVGSALRKRVAQTVIDKTTGQEFQLEHGMHTVFFIRMHKWGAILAAIGVILCVLEWTHARGEGKSQLVAPTPEQLATLLEFSGPVTFERKDYSPEELKKVGAKWGQPLAVYRFRDPARTSQSYLVGVYPDEALFGTERTKMMSYLQKASEMKLPGTGPKIGRFPTKDGRTINQMFLGMGPGGSEYAAFLKSKDGRYELYIKESTDGHDDEDGKEFMHHVLPKKELREIIEALAVIVFGER